MFSRRDSGQDPASTADASGSASRHSGNSGSALIGQSIQVEGSVRGEEDLLIQGEVRGMVELKDNQVTIGSDGCVFADVHAKIVRVEGRIDGRLVASEQVIILGTARITGSITAPRISLNDGARFNGTIDMDPSAERLQAVFKDGSRQTSMDELPAGNG